MRPSTYAALGEMYGEAPFAFRVGDDFTEFIAAYQSVSSVVRTPEDLARLTTEAVQDAAAEGVVWFEPSLLPAPHRPAIGSDDEVIEVVLESGLAAASAAGIGFGLVLVADRHAPPADAEALATLAARRSGSGVVAFGLVGDERHFPGRAFQRAFAIATESGLLAVPHAGELAGPESVRDALGLLNADRLGHGVRAAEDRELLRHLREADVCLDVCPTSNIALRVYENWSQHPLPALLDAGVRCSLNADDPILFGVSVLDEYENARHRMGLADEDLARLADSSVRHSGAPADIKEAGSQRIREWLLPSAKGARDG
jgi:adenosine deaminase